MPQRYHVVPKPDSPSTLDPRGPAQVLAKNGRLMRGRWWRA